MQPKTPRPLTDKQHAILAFITRCNAAGINVTIRAICDEFGFTSPNAATGHLKCLAAKGVVYRDDQGVLLADNNPVRRIA